MSQRITELFSIEFPIVQGGMIWTSGWRLASAVSNAGGLGLIGAGSMYPEVLDEHLNRCKAATKKPLWCECSAFISEHRGHHGSNHCTQGAHCFHLRR